MVYILFKVPPQITGDTHLKKKGETCRSSEVKNVETPHLYRNYILFRKYNGKMQYYAKCV
jgi:hypothetical protein